MDDRAPHQGLRVLLEEGRVDEFVLIGVVASTSPSEGVVVGLTAFFDNLALVGEVEESMTAQVWVVKSLIASVDGNIDGCILVGLVEGEGVGSRIPLLFLPLCSGDAFHQS